MFLIKIINYFKGLLCVRLTGPHCEQVLNVLHRQGVDFWKLYRIDVQSIRFTIYEKDLQRLKSICSRYYTEIKIESSQSFGRLFRYYRKRWGIFSGLIIGVLLLIITGCFIWDVTVTGCDEKTSSTEIVRQFKELGFGIGSFRFGVDLSELENQFMMKNKDVIWVSVNLRFTTANIEVREREGHAEKIYDLTTPCDIFAARDGQIVSMMVTSGTPLVKVGDSVCAGDQLVSREYVDRYGKSIIVHSIATIKAKTARILKVEVPLTENVHTPTGKSKSFFEVNIFNFKIPLYFKENISYNNYDRTETHRVLRISKDLALPISLLSKTYTEVTVETKEVPYDTAKLSALAMLESKEKEQLFQAEILEKNVKEKIVDGQLVLTAQYQCLEDIALTIGD